MGPIARYRCWVAFVRSAVEQVISTQKGFRYFHDGAWKTGFYDPAARLFVGSANGTIRTVITGATQNYIRNLKSVIP